MHDPIQSTRPAWGPPGEFRATTNQTGCVGRPREVRPSGLPAYAAHPEQGIVNMIDRTNRALPLIALTFVLSLLLPGTGRAAEAVDDSYSTPRTTVLTVSAPGILGNDVCDVCVVATVEGISFQGSITFDSSVPDDSDEGGTQPSLQSGATLTVHDDGSFTYDGSAVDPETTTDSFTYQAEDSRGLSAEATVTITLTESPGSSAPVANDDTYSVELGTILTVDAPGILENDTDADEDPLTVSTVEGLEPGSPITLSQGTVTVQTDGSFTYEPNAEATAGADEGFSYTASDGTVDSNSALVGISLVEPTTGDTQASVRFDDVGFVALDSEIGRSEIDLLDITAAAGTTAQAGGAGLPPQTGALILRNSDPVNSEGAWQILRACERMGLLAQAQPVKYDLVVDVFSSTPGSSFSVGGDGEVIIEISETRVRCRTERASDSSSGDGR